MPQLDAPGGSSRGSPKLEQLLAARSALVRRARDLHARHGIGGTFVAQREMLKAELSIDMRTRMEGEGRITQTMIDEAVFTHPTFTAFIAEAESARAELYILYDEIRAANARILEHLALTRNAPLDGVGGISDEPDAG